MAGNEQAIREIRERLDIVEVIGRFVQLRKSGNSYKGLSPFRTEKNPSFSVSQERQLWSDWVLGEHGDLFKFFMKKDNLGFGEALTLLAEMAGVSLAKREAKTSTEAEARREHLLALNESAAVFYQNLLAVHPVGEPGRAYRDKRGISKEIAEEFQLGYAPDAWDTLTNYLQGRGYDMEDAREIGLVQKQEERGTYYDRFRGRFLFPIRDRGGRVVGFGGRALADERPDYVPKYLNSQQSVIFDKSHVLYGIDRAAESIRQKGEAVIVEGYVDALTAHQFGYRNVVATMGTALTEQQIALVKRHAKHIVLALDADAAGRMAMLRAVDTLRNALGDEQAPITDARGIVSMERRVRAQISVLTVPAGKDPDEFIRTDATAWPALVAGATPVLDFVIEAVIAAGEIKTGRGRHAVLTQLAPIIRDIADEVERGVYVGSIARSLHMATDDVALAIRTATQPKRRGAALEDEAVEIPHRNTRAEYVLSLLLRYPKVIVKVVANAPTGIAGAFSNPIHAAIWEAMVEIATDNEAFEDFEAVRERVPEVMHASLDSLLALTAEDTDWYDGRVIADIHLALRTLAVAHGKASIHDLRDLVTAAYEEDDRESVTFYQGEYNRFNALLQLYPPKSTVYYDLQSPRR